MPHNNGEESIILELSHQYLLGVLNPFQEKDLYETYRVLSRAAHLTKEMLPLSSTAISRNDTSSQNYLHSSLLITQIPKTTSVTPRNYRPFLLLILPLLSFKFIII